MTTMNGDGMAGRTTERGVLYMLSGNRHAAVLAVSLWTLRRQHPDLPIAVFAGDDRAKWIIEQLDRDERLGPIIYGSYEASGVRNGGYLDKTRMGDLTPFTETIFLDADTAVVGPLDELWPEDQGRVTLTQFANWTTATKRIARRVAKWEHTSPLGVARTMAETRPAVNTGVLSWRLGDWSRSWFDDWKELTGEAFPEGRPGGHSFMADEIAAQLLEAAHKPRVLDARWNASPIYTPDLRDVRVWHFHGRKHLKKEAGRKVWMPLFQDAYRERAGGMQDWIPAGDTSLKMFLENGVEAFD